MRIIRPLALLLAATLLAGTLAGCGGDDESAGTTGSAASAKRCDQNKAAGTVTYLSGYYWQASASILEVIAADRLGYFKDLCLDVRLQPGSGDVSQNTKLLASGRAQVGGLSQQDTMTANANGLRITGISSYSNAGLDILMTMPSITDLAQLKGKTLGQKGLVPVGVSAMLDKAGLKQGDVKEVKVGYDPTILPRGQVDALVGFISNEPLQLEAAGKPVKVWEPKDFGVPGSLGAYAANPGFLKAHPTAAQDFLRAVFKAYQYCAEEAHVDECIGFQHDKAGAESDPKHETAVWKKETEVVADNPLPGKFGSIDTGNVRALAGIMTQYGGVQVSPDEAAGWFDNSFSDAVVGGDNKVVWPAP
ncbi:ABC transporter substrate-binding protein [Nocardioides sp. CER19]|uniref:ABC transporter substrate-binding protein n=1 Tax=Nocardioides sp. CER19 TaxID=3038538 RepID=UPI0024483656|nr:ABC transporter substrate-binding protein [Nocardioides sp. CER19]MDH2414964.1 ABC transporter substrate-binding protein [Nocardioides sp. CER19]